MYFPTADAVLGRLADAMLRSSRETFGAGEVWKDGRGEGLNMLTELR